MAKKLQFGIVGCGRILPRHIEPLTREIDGTSVAAVCDISPERAKAAGEKYGVPWYLDFHEMLNRHPEIDVVNVLTPSGYHAEHVIELSHYRKHIIVEKPMALTIDDAEAMIQACERNGVRLFVVKQNRYNVPVQKLRSAMVEGKFGKLVLGTVRVRWCRHQEYYDKDAWRGTWSLDGGVIANQASHHVDLLTWLMGDVESVFAYTATRLAKIEADDTAVAVLKFANGALGVFEATTATRPVDLEGSVSVLGENGTVEIGGFAVNTMKTWRFKEETDADREVLTIYKENPPNVYGFGHTRFLQSVVHSILAERKEAGDVDGLEGLKSLILISAMYESMESGKEVKLRFRPHMVRLGRPTDARTVPQQP